MGGEIIDVDAELGLAVKDGSDTPPEHENKPEICEKSAKTGDYFVPEDEISDPEH
jgi:hypothetical protein